jgi:hypothetical protein
MMMKAVIAVAAILGVAAFRPAHATCMKNEAALPHAEVMLTSPTGKALKRTTRADGTLRLRGLRVGEWTGRIAALGSITKLSVARNGKLAMITVRQTTHCQAPPRPREGHRLSHPSVRNVIKQIAS